jgi:glycosyltransferase involved in cell wall biosynthesis
MKEEKRLNEDVMLLLPGEIVHNKAKRCEVSIKKGKPFCNIPTYMIKNPLPIPMANGIQDIAWYTLLCDKEIYVEFLSSLRPDVIHIHTFMGLHQEFLQGANQLTIPVIYTTHDYFGLCPKTDLIYNDEICTNPGDRCVNCNRHAFGEKRLLLEQSNIYRTYRNNKFLIELFRSPILRNYFQKIRSTRKNDDKQIESKQVTVCSNYRRLIDYYHIMFKMISFFHYNSNLTRETYESILGNTLGKVLNLSNNSISDNRKSRKVKDKLRIGFLGGDYRYKGLHRLRKVVSDMFVLGMQDIELHVFGVYERIKSPFVIYHDTFTCVQMEEVFNSMDILAVPSYWAETFGMVVPEAISYGIPVIVTNRVGAKDLLVSNLNSIGIVVDSTEEALKSALIKLYMDTSIINGLNVNIINMDFDFRFPTHVQNVIALYKHVHAGEMID